MTDGKKSRPLLYGPDGKPLSFSASTAPARKDHKTQQAPPKRARRPATKRNERSFGFWKTMISVLTIAASLVGLYAVYPRISVMPGEVSYNDADPFRVPLHVSNDGLFTIYKAELTCTDVEFNNPSRHNDIAQSQFSQAGDLPIGDLAGGGFTTTACPGGLVGAARLMAPGDKVTARMTVTLSFRPSFWWKRINQPFHLLATSEADRHIHWMVTSK